MLKKIFIFILLFTSTAIADPRIGTIMSQLHQNYDQIKSASADITLDFNLMLLGCTGLERWTGDFYYKFPDLMKTTINQEQYFAKGNNIRKIDAKGRYFYVKLINAIDMANGFNVGVVPYNFNLKILKDLPDQIVLQGIPKPGILKNAKKVIFYIDPKKHIIEKFDVLFDARYLTGTIYLDHQLIGNIWVPVGFHGKTAIEVAGGSLVGLSIKLKGANFKLNPKLSDKLFDPGF